MLATPREMRIGARYSLPVVGESAAGHHHGPSRGDCEFAFVIRHLRAAYRAILNDEVTRGGACEQWNAQIEACLGQSCRQSVTAGDLDPPAIKSQILQMADQSLCHIRGGLERSRRAEKVLKVFIRRIEHHPDESDSRQRRPQSLQFAAEAASVEGRCRHGPTY